ncbi:hypothetical protein TNCV_1103791 [Trichonephila clavipes]|nr:hypothetical protein TNCV_1103791 [Trichonephila clavipes]
MFDDDIQKEFEEELPEVKNSIHDELESLRSTENKKELSWTDLIGKNLRMVPVRQIDLPQNPYQDIELQEDYIDYSPNEQLNDFERDRIVRMRAAGWSYRGTGRHLQRTDTVAQRCWQQRGISQRNEHSGRPRCTNARQDRVIV